MTKTNEESNKKSRVRGKDLVLGIDKNGRIIKFNDECEKISGYNKNEVLNKDLYDFFIPERYLTQWKNVFNSIRRNKLIDDFKLPLLTQHGHEIMVSWSSFPVKNHNGEVGDIGLVGRLVMSWDDSTEPVKVPIEKKLEEKVEENVFQDLEKVIKHLEKKNTELEMKNKKLQRNLKSLKTKMAKKKKASKTDPVGKSVYRMSDAFGGKKKKEELNALMHELDEREKQLNKLEKKLNKEKIKISEQKNDFIRWREKLESLENKIYDRETEIKKQKKLLSAPLAPQDKTIDKQIDQRDLIDKLQDCAAVIQRGILKQVNDPFIDLLGYKSEEVIDKSLLDFVVPEGLSGVEEYYLGRLKGDEVTVYETVFLTKDNDIVSVEVSTKPTIFKNEKAEIAIFKKLKPKKEEKSKN
jgi:PAS domain S-box-containing protein